MVEFPWGGSKSDSGSERDGSRCLDVDQSFGDFERRALSLAAGVSMGVAEGKLGAEGKVGGAATRGVKWVSSEGWEVDGPGIGGDSLLPGVLLRLRRSLGKTGALADASDDEPGTGALPTPPPSILISSLQTEGGGREEITCLEMMHVPDALSQATMLCVTFHKWTRKLT